MELLVTVQLHPALKTVTRKLIKTYTVFKIFCVLNNHIFKIYFLQIENFAKRGGRKKKRKKRKQKR